MPPLVNGRMAEPGLKERQRIRRARRLDRLLGVLLIPLWSLLRFLGGSISRRQPEVPCGPVQKILFIKLWGVGSICLSEPALRRLRQRHPGARIDYLTLQRNVELFELVPAVSRVHTLSFRSLPGLVRQTVSLVTKLRRQAYDEVFDAEFFVNFSALLARAVGGRVTGFAHPKCLKRKLQDRSVSLRSQAHTSAQFLDLVGQANDPSSPPVRPQLLLPVRSVDQRFRTGDGQAFFPFRSRYWVLNINASPLALERRWPWERFLHLSRQLLSRYALQVVLIGSACERDYVAKMERRLGYAGRVVNLCGCLSLPDLAHLLSRARFLISNDSGPVHLASALNVPVVALYGPETPLRYGPLSSAHLVLYEKLWCSPCMNPEEGKSVDCVNSLACMKRLDSTQVGHQVREFLQRHQLVEEWKETADREIRVEGDAFA